MTDAYASSGVDAAEAHSGVGALVDVLRTIELGGPSRSRLASGHYASVIEVAPNLGIALGTDGVGWVLSAMTSILTQLLTIPVVAGITVSLYLDLRVRTEGLDLELDAIEAFPPAA